MAEKSELVSMHCAAVVVFSSVYLAVCLWRCFIYFSLSVCHCSWCTYCDFSTWWYMSGVSGNKYLFLKYSIWQQVFLLTWTRSQESSYINCSYIQIRENCICHLSSCQPWDSFHRQCLQPLLFLKVNRSCFGLLVVILNASFMSSLVLPANTKHTSFARVFAG